MTWNRGICEGMTTRQVRGLQKSRSVVTIRLKDGRLIAKARLLLGVIETLAAFQGLDGSEGDFALDQVDTWFFS